MSENLWGDLPLGEDVRTPHSILQEQAQFLTNQTKGLLVGRVVRSQQNDTFLNTLQIIAPALNNYSYSILTASHRIELYPVTVMCANKGYMADSEERFLGLLKTQLQLEQVRKVITGLLAQIRADTAEKESLTKRDS